MIYKLFYTITCFVFLISFETLAQDIEYSNELKEKIDEDVRTPLLSALDSLTSQIAVNSVNEKYFWKKEALFSKAIFEDIYNYVESYRDSSKAISTSLLNCYPIGKGRYLNQLAYYKQTDGASKSLQMILNIVAHVNNGEITFSTPLSYYTKTWKEKKVGSILYYFRDNLNIERAELCAQKNMTFASKFNLKPYEFNFYMVENYQEFLRLVGFEYNIGSIGKLRDGYGPAKEEVIFSVMNNEDFSHDIFHYYSETLHEWSVHNWVTEEGLAYSWGNAYYTRKDGEMAEQKELLTILKEYLNQNKDTNLLQLFENNFWTDTSGIFENLAPDFIVGRLISSLICDEVHKIHGMEGINQMLTIGSKPNHFDPFLEATNKLIGINRKNFNKKVTLLITEYK